jgi:uncharacterized protein
MSTQIPIDWIYALLGGGIIGIAVSIMLLFNGRVTGISGIIFGTLTPKTGDTFWRVCFILGLLFGGVLLNSMQPQFFQGALDTSLTSVVIAGLLVGFGTILGSGCTSGHGVCGISRMSIRSILATVTFISAGICTIIAIRFLGVQL